MNFPASTYEGQSQRFIQTLWIKDEIGGYKFSSTATFLKFRNNFFCIFAGHALPKNSTSLNNIGFLNIHGEFVSLSEITYRFRSYDNYDIVVCGLLGEESGKNYFDLSDDEVSSNFQNEMFNWIGFPYKKATSSYHRTKVEAGKISQDIVQLDDGTPFWKNAKFLIMEAKFLGDDGIHITGYSPSKNVTYEIEGFKENAYSPKGMSGGALFQSPKKEFNLTQPLNELFYFVGMGIEYENDKIKGVSRNIILNLLEEFFTSPPTYVMSPIKL